MSKKLLKMKKKIVSLLLGSMLKVSGMFAQTPTPVEIMVNGGFELGTTPTSVNQVNHATGWSTGCGLQPIGGTLPYPLGTPDLCDRAIAGAAITGIPGTGVETRNGVSNRRFVHMLPTMATTVPETYGETIKGSFTESLAAGFTYSATCYYARTHYVGCITGYQIINYQIQFVLRKDNDCTLEKIVYTSGNTIADNTKCGTGSYQNNWHKIGGVFTLTQADVNQGYNRLEIRIKGKGDILNELFIDDVSLTKRPSPEAHFQFTNPGVTIKNESTFYGSLPVTQLCQTFPSTCVTINGGASNYETGYYLSVAEFTPSTWTSATPMYSQWVSTTSPVPTSDINLCNLSGVTFQPGKVYLVGLSVGPEWTTENKLIRINPTTTLSAIPDQTICSGASASISLTSNGWPINVYNGATLLGTYNSSPIILPATTVTTTYKFSTWSKLGCTSSDLATITVSTCPNASFVFNNPGQTVANENSMYGPIPVTTMCADKPSYCVSINGSASTLEDRYYISISEFDLNTWTNIVSNTAPNVSPLWNNWVCVGCTVPTNKNLCDLVNLTPGAHFQIGKLYRVVLAVGIPWNSVEKYIRIKDCAPQARLVGPAETEVPEISNSAIRILPNPTTSEFTLDFEGETVKEVSVIDAIGKVVSEKKIETTANSASFNLTDYPEGIYFVKINTGEKIIMKRLVKE